MIDQEKMQIREIIPRKYPHIALAYLFGSRVEGNIGPQSDYDFGILLDRNADKAAVRSSLASDLAGLLYSPLIDVVFLDQAPIELSFAVISQGEILYERDIAARVNFEAKVMGLYFDYLPFLRMSRDDILKEDPYAARVLRDIFARFGAKIYFRFAGGKDELGRDILESSAVGGTSGICRGCGPLDEAKAMKRIDRR